MCFVGQIPTKKTVIYLQNLSPALQYNNLKVIRLISIQQIGWTRMKTSVMVFSKINRSLALLLVLFLPLQISAQKKDKPEDLFKMSLEELMNAEIAVPAAITHLTKAETPASVTVISAEDIKHTPARNIYDLIEVYVPGAVWMNYEEGPQIGLRGIVSNQNNKYILRVNERTLNNKTQYGAMSELEQWNMKDIKEIEIIRGPGSVTYGPGAIAGVINIITHDAHSAEGLNASVNYLNKYNSKGGSLSFGYKSENFNIYSYVSVTGTSGFTPDNFIVSKNGEAGYIGKDIKTDTEALDYFSDYQDNPQIKLFVHSELFKNIQFMVRYTQQGSTWHGNEAKADINGKLLNLQSLRNRQLSATLIFEKQFNDELRFSSLAGYSFSDAFRRGGKARIEDPDHILNKKVDFGETDIFFKGLLNWQTFKWAEIAAGFEYSWNFFGSGWGKDETEMRLGDNGIIVSGPDSKAILEGNNGSADRDGTAIFVGDGWSTNTLTFFSESNIEIQPWLKLLLSGRADKNTYTDWMFSPRLALISNITKGHYIKFIAQKALRMNTAPQLYAATYNGNKIDTEALEGFELIYSAYINDNVSINFSGYRNNIDFIA